jgi:hypothetical protein
MIPNVHLPAEARTMAIRIVVAGEVLIGAGIFAVLRQILTAVPGPPVPGDFGLHKGTPAQAFPAIKCGKNASCTIAASAMTSIVLRADEVIE